MPQFVIFMDLTEEGARQVTEAPMRMREWQEIWETHGGPVVILATTGAHDFVAVGELHAAKDAVHIALELTRDGFVRPTTARGYTDRELQDVMPDPNEMPIHIKFQHERQ